jgi:hypothetical protein
MEAITRKKEVDEMKTLTKEFSTLGVDKAGVIYTIQNDVFGWEQITPTQQFFVARTYFDLGGLTMDDKTLFFEAAGVQDVHNPTSVPAAAGNLAVVIDILSNKPLTNTECLSVISFGNMLTTVSANLTFDQTIYMRHRIYNTDLDNVAGSYMITLSDNQLGSMSPTASDRVYVTRIVSFAGGDGSYTVTPVRYIVRATAKEEPEFEYLMRLKRSYELQQEPDRD